VGNSPAEKASDRLTTVLWYGVLLVLIYLVYRIYEPFLAALGWAGVLVVFFYPVHARLKKKLGNSRAALVSTAGVVLLLITPTILLAALFAREALSASRGLQQTLVEQQVPALTRTWSWIAHHVPGVDPELNLFQTIRDMLQKQAGFIASQLGTALRNLATFVFDLFVMVLAIFYLFRDADGVMRSVRQILPFEEETRDAILGQARDLISASVTTSLIIAAIQGILGGIAFALVKLENPVFWGVVMAFFSLVPVVGSGLIFVPAAIWLAINGHWWSAIILVGICAGVSVAVDNVVRPVLLGGRTELSGLVIFISVVGGVSVFGMLGLVLGPILVATTAGILGVYFNQAGKKPATAR
jgi:predicted PurR-regulated permease PerM